MSFVSQDNQNLLWELIAESGLLHTVADRIPMVQKQYQSLLMRYQYDTSDITEKNKKVIHEMISYIKSVQAKNETNENIQSERMKTLQDNMNAHEAHFKQYNQPKQVEEIDFSDPTPDPNSLTPIQQILDSKQLERTADNKIDMVLKDLQEVKTIMLDIQKKLNENQHQENTSNNITFTSET